MKKKIILAVCCLAALAGAVIAGDAWTAYRNKQRFDTVLAEYAKDQSAHR